MKCSTFPIFSIPVSFLLHFFVSLSSLTVFFSFFVLLCTPSVFASVAITEILYNPLITESGGEAVELYNSDNREIDLSGYAISTASSIHDAVLPAGSIIPANGYFLVADANWATKKDDPGFPIADYEEAMTLLNTNGWVLLRNSTDAVIDAVCWGDISAISFEYCTGEPAVIGGNGESLQKINSFGDNKRDFISAVPQFVNSRGKSHPDDFFGLHITAYKSSFVAVNATNVSLIFDYNSTLVPYPGITRRVAFSSVLPVDLDVKLSFNGEDYLLDDSAINTTYSRYSGFIDIPFTLNSGRYNLSLYSDGLLSYSHVIDIPSVVGIDLDASGINCTLSKSNECLITGDLDFQTRDKPSIRNIGNTPVDTYVYLSNKTGLTQLPIGSSLKVSFDGSLPSAVLSQTPQKFMLNLLPSLQAFKPLSVSLLFPSLNQSSLSTQLFVMAVVHE